MPSDLVAKFPFCSTSSVGPKCLHGRRTLMIGSRFQGRLIALTLALTIPSAVWSQPAPAPPGFPPGGVVAPPPPAPPSFQDSGAVCKIYQLRDISESEDVRSWVKATIPEMIHPGTWGNPSINGIGNITYDAKSGLLAVRHVAAAHAEIDEFLKRVKSSVKEPAPVERKAVVKQAGFTPAGVSEAAKTEPGYPAPPPLQQPKHLFHFVIRFEGSGMDATLVDLARKLAAGDIDTKDDAGKTPFNQLLHFIVRYEGEGIIDANVVEFMKVYARMANQEKEKTGSDPLVGESPKAAADPNAPVNKPP